MLIEIFGKRIQAFLRACGYTQKQLANELGMHHKVLSRKLNGTTQAYFTHLEIRALILVLVKWQVITRQEEILALLSETEIDASAIFRPTAWHEPPLNGLGSDKQKSPRVSTEQRPSLHNLSAPIGELIGRSWAVARLQQQLGRETIRLVTLIGPGGSGKTRLALRVAHELVSIFAQGAWFVSFASISDPSTVPLTMAQALNIKSAPGQQPLQSILTYLGRRHMLLVLDNFEHIAAARGMIEELLAAAPNLKILVTSRVVLGLPGEYEFSVPPLDLPDPALAAHLEVSSLATYSAIQLFVERAQAVLPAFTLTNENSAVVAQICACADGLPLALELAAARVKILSPTALLERLTQARLPLLTRVDHQPAGRTASRHQTLRNTITWSYNLLSRDEQVWFRRLGIFSDDWSLESAEAMMREISADEQNPCAPSSPLDLLTQLVNNSLLASTTDAHGAVSFTLLSTLREYALERLQACGETTWLHDWHACYYLRLAEAGEAHLHGPHQRGTLTRLTAARANLQAALQWSLQQARKGRLIHAFAPVQEQDAPPAVSMCRTFARSSFPAAGVSAREISLRLAAALRAYWEWLGFLGEVRYWLNAALALAPTATAAGPTQQAAHARALSESARLLVLQNEQERALAMVDESIALWRKLDDPPGLAIAQLHRGWALHGNNQYTAADQAYRDGLAVLSPTTDTWLYAELLLHLGATAGFTSDFEQARLYYTRCRELFTQIGDQSAVADAWKDQGGILILAGQYDEAIAYLLTSVQMCRALDHKQYIATALGLLSFAFGLHEKPDAETASLSSAQVQGAAESLMSTIGLTPWTETTPFIQAVRQHIRSRVDAERWQAALDSGRALSLSQALDLIFRLAQETTTQEITTQEITTDTPHS